MKDFYSTASNQPSSRVVGMPTHVRNILHRARRPMTLTALLDALADVMDLEECPDPLHNLRGVTTKGVRDGWLERLERGIYQLASDAQPKIARKTPTPTKESPAPVVRASEPRARRRSRRVKKSLEIMVGDITLRTPSGMRPDALARLVQAIRGASN